MKNNRRFVGDEQEERELISEENPDSRKRLTQEALRVKYGKVNHRDLIQGNTMSGREIAKRDFGELVGRVNLDAPKEISPLLLMRSVQGHAHSGHCEFRGRRYPNFTIDDSVEANIDTLNSLLNGHSRRLTPYDIKSRCQEVIDDIQGCMDDIIAGKKVSRLVNSRGEPLAGANIFLEQRIDDNGQDPLDVVRGFYLGSCMDNYKWRKKVKEKYKLTMGGGVCCPVDVKKLELMGFDLGFLSESEFEKPEFSRVLEDLLAEGVVVFDRNVQSGDYSNGYVRMRMGQGISDDCAVINAGFMYNDNYARGVFLADAVDTWGTYVPVLFANGQDEIMGLKLKERAEKGEFDLELTEEEIIEFIYLSAINPDPQFSDKYPDSSQRYFLQKSEKGLSAVRSHFNFMRQLRKEIFSNQRYRKPNTPSMRLGFSRVNSRDFYCEVRGKIIQYLKENNFLDHGITRCN